MLFVCCFFFSEETNVEMVLPYLSIFFGYRKLWPMVNYSAVHYPSIAISSCCTQAVIPSNFRHRQQQWTRREADDYYDNSLWTAVHKVTKTKRWHMFKTNILDMWEPQKLFCFIFTFNYLPFVCFLVLIIASHQTLNRGPDSLAQLPTWLLFQHSPL